MATSLFKLVMGILGFLMLSVSSTLAGDPSGIWLRATGSSKIQIYKCGNSYCGKVVWLREPIDPATGKPKTDNKNPDASRHNRPLIGTRVILNMQPDGENKWRGRVYVADEGKIYNGTMELTNPNTLKLAGCVLGGLICKKTRMTRTN